MGVDHDVSVHAPSDLPSVISHPSSTVILVTGASGFIASHAVHLLLKRGYRVRGTVRSLNNAAKVNPIRRLDTEGRLELVEADLLDANSWPKAMEGVTFVLHLASPFPIVADDTVIPTAVEGTLNVLRAASKCPSVQKVVLTSSCTTVNEGHDQDHAFTEEEWTDVDDPRVGLYPKSKTLAERAAWKFHSDIPAGDNKFRLTTICPVLVVGPPLIDEQGSSISIIRKLLQHEMPATPPMQLALVDVRDVALIHVEAMLSKEADNQRFLAASQPSYWFRDLSRILGKEFKDQGYHTPRFEAPGFIVRLKALFCDEDAASIICRLHDHIRFDVSKAEKILGIKFRNTDESLLEMAYVMIERGIVRKKNGYKGCPKKFREFVDL